MLRLLLENDRKNIRREYHLRFLNVALLLFSVVLFVWIVSMVPAFINIFSEEKVLSSQRGSTETTELLRDREVLENKFSEVRQRLNILDTEQYVVTDLIREVVSKQVRSVKLNNITFGGKEEKPFMELQGISNNRESLVEFSRELESSEYFVSVDVPFSNFTRDVDIPFTIMISLKSLNDK